MVFNMDSPSQFPNRSNYHYIHTTPRWQLDNECVEVSSSLRKTQPLVWEDVIKHKEYEIKLKCHIGCPGYLTP